MSDLIERETVIKLAYSRIDGIDRLYGQSHPDASDWEYAIDNAPTVDAVLVIHGEWGNYDEYNDGYRCSRCKLIHRTATKFCPRCGARMEHVDA